MAHSVFPSLTDDFHSCNGQHLYLLTTSQLKLPYPSDPLPEGSLHLGAGRGVWRREFAQLRGWMACDLMPSEASLIEGQDLVDEYSILQSLGWTIL